MRNVEGTITDPKMDRLININPADNLDSDLLSFSVYQEDAASTAIYPRVYTEDQVRTMLAEARYSDVASLSTSTASWEDVLLDRFETDFSRLVYPVLGLLGETGELANKLKKVARDGKGMQTNEQTQDIVQELGDVQWYVAAIATEAKASLGQIALDNLKKLFSRKQRGVLSGSGDNR